MENIAIVEALLREPSGLYVRPSPPVYVAIPKCLEGKCQVALFAQHGRVLLANDGYESTLILKAFWGLKKEALLTLVGEYFKEDNPDNLLNWLM